MMTMEWSTKIKNRNHAGPNMKPTMVPGVNNLCQNDSVSYRSLSVHSGVCRRIQSATFFIVFSVRRENGRIYT